MGKDKSANKAPTAELKTIEELAKDRNTKLCVFAAVREAAGWASGLRMSGDAYDRIVDAWLCGAMNGR